MKRKQTIFRPERSPGGQRNAGFTLIELMVGLTVAMLLMLLVSDAYTNTIWRKRDIAGSNDALKTASVTLFQIANSLKQAGNMQGSSPTAWGCKLQASRGGTTLLPLPSALPAPFVSLPTVLRLAPVIVQAGADDPDKRESDIILTMASDLGGVGLPFKLLSKPAGRVLSFANSNGLLAGDLLLTTQQNNEVCHVTQIDHGHSTSHTNGKLDRTPDSLSVGGDYALAGALNALQVNDAIYGLGRTPRFNAFGVDSSTQSLNVYDLLQIHGINGPTPIAENVFLLKALYGVDTDGDNGVDEWFSPKDAGWQFNDLHANTGVARAKLARIKAIRLALVTRGSYPGMDRFAATLDLFSSVTGQQQTINLTDSERRYRYQVYESITPLFNVKTLDG